jgi:ATP-dependent Clp protease adapter protein ClpS
MTKNSCTNSVSAKSAEVEEIIETKPIYVAKQKTEPKNEPLKHYHVILHDSDKHTPEYVFKMITEIFHYEKEKVIEIIKKVHYEGKVIVATTHKEKAELYQEQIHSYGKDIMISDCQGSMFATIEPTA